MIKPSRIMRTDHGVLAGHRFEIDADQRGYGQLCQRIIKLIIKD